MGRRRCSSAWKRSTGAEEVQEAGGSQELRGARVRPAGRQRGINIIADPDWDRERFRVIREWCLEIPEIVNVSVNTPYPGTETWATEGRKLATRDYRLFDIQHAVLPTRLPLAEFYGELATQQILNRKHLGARQIWGTAKNVARLLAHGQTNFLRMLFKFNSVYDPELQLADHRPVGTLSAPARGRSIRQLYVHRARSARTRIDDPPVVRRSPRMGVAP
jgi:hypothetical protein